MESPVPALRWLPPAPAVSHHCKASRQLLRAHWALQQPQGEMARPSPCGWTSSWPGALQASGCVSRALHVLGFLLSTLTVSFPGIIPYSNRRSHPCWGVEVLIAPLRGCSLLTLGKFSGAYLPRSVPSLSLPSFLPVTLCLLERVWPCLLLLPFLCILVGYSVASVYSVWLIQLLTKFIVLFHNLGISDFILLYISLLWTESRSSHC